MTQGYARSYSAISGATASSWKGAQSNEREGERTDARRVPPLASRMGRTKAEQERQERVEKESARQAMQGGAYEEPPFSPSSPLPLLLSQSSYFWPLSMMAPETMRSSHVR